MADPIISALVEDLVGRLTSAAIQEYGLLRGLEKDLSALNKTFELIQAVLYDAEEKQKTQMDVEVWLKTLKSASLEVENVLDEAKTEAMIRRLHREMGKKYRIRAFFSYRYNPVMVRFRIAHKVKNIRKQLEDIDANRSRFQLISNTRSEDGAGIAKLVYNDETVKTHFDLKCWVYVSSVFDVKRIIKAICGLEDKKLDEMSLDVLLGQLQNKLKGKKYVIIMDDVWLNHDSHEDMVKWEELCTALSCGAKGSTVMVTTRKEDLAKRVAIPELLHNVGVLSEKDSWSLFKMLAFPVRGVGENVSSELEREGKEREGKQIVKKCNGLPLAVKSLGSLMSTKETVEKWQRVNKNFKSNIQDNVLTALRLSYDDLPPHMKICFAYSCVFLKGEELSKDRLIELWMANGFIPSQGDASLYELGEDIFDCLVGRSFFQDVVEKDIDTGAICKMHDLMHDLAEHVMKHDCAVIESGKESIIPDEVLHLSLSCEDFELSKEDLKKLRSVRSMLYWNYTSNLSQIANHVYLRVLYLNGIKSSTLPESICKLIHLRYLKISDSWIEVLPESIIYLQNLQTLILEECRWFRELPKGLRYMRNLQRLDIIGYSPELQHMPVGIKELTNLRRLSKFAVGRDKGARIGELGNMNLVGMRKLRLSGLENVGGLREAESANLKDKTNLKSLELMWNRSEETNDSEVVEGLEPNSGLHELSIWNYMGRVLSPSWMVKLVNLTSIKFYEVNKCEQLPPLGKLPSLKIIQLWFMPSIKCFHDEDNSTSKDEILFPSLQELQIGFCGSLVSLPNNFPKLQSLEIDRCEKLGCLPDEIQSFKDLNQITILGCEILSRRCEKEIGEDWPKISHIPHLDIRNLQRLDIGHIPGFITSFLKHMPVGIKELTNLRRLSQFVVGKDGGARIGELGNMNLLGRDLMLKQLENVGGLRDAKSANLKDKTNLKSLTLEWTWGRSEETNDSEVVEGLEPNSGLQELTIWGYMGRCEQLPPLGKLPSLKSIKLDRMKSVKCFHDEDNSTSKDEILFPSLQELHILNCSDLVSLPNNFPKLQSLEIDRCEKLGCLPDEIQSFKDLNQITILGCEILSGRCEKEIGEDWPKISHIPHRSIY
ncbi:Disease resistance protein [Artemisia annua]|uniref:Disease resistance protein n=1 Tax=Artemisia annua TaxID=35608 RepID=A0A2U1MGW0_ARTAN|nr:Disease resistance protein [Artemisia annua]